VACERHGAGDVAGRQHLWAVSRVPRPAGDSGLAGSVGSGVIDGFLFFFGDTRFWCFYFLFLPATPGFEHGWLCAERVEARAAPRVEASSLLIQTTVALGLR
jgi:hypothetical protein